jgi:hypothetical protein
MRAFSTTMLWELESACRRPANVRAVKGGPVHLILNTQSDALPDLRSDAAQWPRAYLVALREAARGLQAIAGNLDQFDRAQPDAAAYQARMAERPR